MIFRTSNGEPTCSARRSKFIYPAENNLGIVTHRALVAFETRGGDGEPVYDVHFSQNGAESLVLKQVLEVFLDREDESVSDLPEFRGAAIEELEEIANHDALQVDSDLVTEEPMHTDVPESELGDVVDYVFHEALFVCDQDTVDVYLPVFICPDVLKPFRHHVALFAERPESPPSDPRELAKLPQQGAAVEISGSEYDEIDIDGGSPEAEILTDALQGLLQGVYACKQESNTHTEATTQLWLDDWTIVCEVSDIPTLQIWPSQGSGFLVAFADDAQQHAELLEMFHESRHTANELLLESSLTMSNRPTPTREDEIEALGTLLRDIVHTFNYDISHLSPSPFPDLVESL
jgi:hypothetical protein